MKKSMSQKSKKKKKHLKKELIISLADGSKFDFFKLPNDMKESIMAEIPAVREALKDFKGMK